MATKTSPRRPTTAAKTSPAKTSPVKPGRAAPPKAARKVAAPAQPQPEAAPLPKKARPKLVRDGFTMPEADFALIASLKARALELQRPVKKSELLRAGLRALAALKPAELHAALEQLEPIRTGRPKKGH